MNSEIDLIRLVSKKFGCNLEETFRVLFHRNLVFILLVILRDFILLVNQARCKDFFQL